MIHQRAYALLLITLCIAAAYSRTHAQQPAATQPAATQPAATQPAATQPARAEYAGTLEEKLAPDMTSVYGPRLKIATANERKNLPVKLKARDKVSVGVIAPPGFDKTPFAIAVIERHGKPIQLFIDLDRDKKFNRRERFSFKPSEAKESGFDGSVSIEIPLSPTSNFASLPLPLYLSKPSAPESYAMLDKDMKPGELVKPPSDAADRKLLHPYSFFAVGKVGVDGREVLVRYGFDPAKNTIDARKGQHAMDSNLDGRIDADIYSPERAYAQEETIVFRVGDRFLSTKSVDLQTRRIVLQAHTPDEYTRIELLKGSLMPDFAFTDFEGRERRISDYRGKYLLLEFWGSWCPPCVAEIPHLKKAYEKYRERGFEIVGMNIEMAGKDDKPLKTDADYAEKLIEMRDFARKHEMVWAQATTASIRDLTRERLRINIFPTTILLDPEGRIVSLGENDSSLRSEELLTTLERLTKN